MSQILRCDICGEEFVNSWTLEEAKQEYEQRNRKPLPSDVKIACDNCYQKEIYMDTKIKPTGTILGNTLKNIRYNVLDKQYLTARQKAHNVMCDECGHVYLSSRGTCPQCNSRRRQDTSEDNKPY